MDYPAGIMISGCSVVRNRRNLCGSALTERRYRAKVQMKADFGIKPSTWRGCFSSRRGIRSEQAAAFGHRLAFRPDRWALLECPCFSPVGCWPRRGRSGFQGMRKSCGGERSSWLEAMRGSPHCGQMMRAVGGPAWLPKPFASGSAGAVACGLLLLGAKNIRHRNISGTRGIFQSERSEVCARGASDFYTTMPAATVSWVPGSTRMKEPVRRLRR